MRKISTYILSVAMLAGCAGKTWYKPGVTEQEFNMDNSRCIMTSEAGTPIYNPAPTSYTTNYSGNVYSGGNSGYYSGSATTYSNQIDMSGFAIAAKKQKIYEHCMYSLGYSIYSEGSTAISSSNSHLTPPPNALSTTPRSSNTKAIRPYKKDLPITLYAEPTSASKEVFVLSEPVTLQVLAETDGMYKVRTSDGIVGWIGKSFVTVELNSFGDVKCLTSGGAILMAPEEQCKSMGRKVID